MRLVYLIAGFLSLALGFVGMALPLLPTVPLIILAAFFFSKSSPRFEFWLINHPVFGQAIREWREKRAISMRGKKAATFAIGIVFLVSVMFSLPVHVLAIQAAVLGAVLVFIWTRSTASRDAD